ncbi:hypothetical protein F4826_004805 [Rahnella inusitata]|nr:hypothetical protein [Rahnella inusitata]
MNCFSEERNCVSKAHCEWLNKRNSHKKTPLKILVMHTVYG